MSVLAGPVYAFAGVLGVAGVVKLGRPDDAVRALDAAGLPGSVAAVRVLGGIEIVAAAAAVAFGGPLSGAILALFYLGFAAFAARLARRGPSTSCGCFGAQSVPVTSAHVAINALGTAVATASIAWPAEPLTVALADAPFAGIPFLVLVLVCGWLVYVALTTLPSLQLAMRELEPASDGTR
jgi:hypothetical protein